MHQSSTSTYIPNFIEIEQNFLWTYGRAEGHLRLTLLGRLGVYWHLRPASVKGHQDCLHGLYLLSYVDFLFLVLFGIFLEALKMTDLKIRPYGPEIV